MTKHRQFLAMLSVWNGSGSFSLSLYDSPPETVQTVPENGAVGAMLFPPATLAIYPESQPRARRTRTLVPQFWIRLEFCVTRLRYRSSRRIFASDFTALSLACSP
jgi:hypothetical protein